MNRRSFFAFLGLAPVAIATGAVAEASQPKHLYGLGTISSSNKLPGAADIFGLAEALEDAKFDLDFERHGSEWLSRAYEENIEMDTGFEISLHHPGREYLPGKVRFRDFVGPEDTVFVTPTGRSISVLNTATDRTAYAPRQALRLRTT